MPRTTQHQRTRRGLSRSFCSAMGESIISPAPWSIMHSYRQWCVQQVGRRRVSGMNPTSNNPHAVRPAFCFLIVLTGPRMQHQLLSRPTWLICSTLSYCFVCAALRHAVSGLPACATPTPSSAASLLHAALWWRLWSTLTALPAALR